MSYMEEHSIDLAFVQETWIKKSDQHLIKEIEEYGYTAKLYRKRRRLDLGGGVAVIHKTLLKIHEVKTEKHRSFECITCKLMTEGGAILFSNIYRPDYSAKNRYTANKFNSEFILFIEELGTHAIPTILLGDYNFHMETLFDSYKCFDSTKYELKKKKEALAFHNILRNNDFKQLVDMPTHELGGTLDLLILQNGSLELTFWDVIDKGIVCDSDHFPIVFTIKGRPLVADKTVTFTYQNFKSFDKQMFTQNLSNLNLLANIELMGVCDMVIEFNENLSTALNMQCPPQVKTVKKRGTLARHWYTDDLRNMKRQKRQCERAWLKCKCFMHKEQYDESLRMYKLACNTERSQYYTNVIEECKDDPKTLHKTVKDLMGDTESPVLPSFKSDKDLADQMGDFYSNKIIKIREEIDNIRTKTTYTQSDIYHTSLNSNFMSFSSLSDKDTRDLIRSLNNKHHPDDPIPVWLLKQNEEIFLPIIKLIVNTSLMQGTFPSTLKHATIRPIIKDKDLDKEIFKNYRPVSNTPFLSKLIEKAANNQITKYLEQNNLFPSQQSAYRKHHSCETAMVKIMDDIQQSVSEKKMVMLVLIDLSSAFDTVDQDILLFKLLNHFGITGTVLEWIKSYLKGRTFSVRIQNVNGKMCLLIYGVPQGTILGPLLFVLYIHDIVSIGEKYDVSVELYADDCSWYYSFSPLSERSLAIQNVNKCMNEIKTWMEMNYLKVNFDKTDTIFLSNPLYHSVFYDNICCTVLGKEFANDLEKSVKMLGTHLDNNLTMNKMVNECIKTCYFNLKKLGGIRRLLSQDIKLRMVVSYVISRLDYCNALYANISKTRLTKLQKLLNACVRFIFGLTNNTDVYECSKSLHILPVKYRIMYKLCLLVYKTMYGFSPLYLEDKIEERTTINLIFLRSNLDMTRLELPLHQNSIQYAMAKHWNTLPIALCSCNSIEKFKSQLKTHYFTKAFPN